MAKTEHERLETLRQSAGRSPRVPLGIGDDAALLQLRGSTVISVDTQVEDIHFRRGFADWRTLGRRACIAALSDLAAMGASPAAVFSSLVLPTDYPDDAFAALTAGIADAANEVGAVVAGGNLSAGPCVMIDTTVVGELPSANAALRRSGARVNDGIFVRGYPGAAALGLAALLQGKPSAAPTFVESWRRPQVDIAYARAQQGRASAAIDISDGLLADLSHLCAASNVSAVIDPSCIPQMAGFETDCAALACSPVELMLRGGEVYDLLLTSPSPLPDAARIGTIVTAASKGGEIFDLDGRPLKPEGHDHFASATDKRRQTAPNSPRRSRDTRCRR